MPIFLLEGLVIGEDFIQDCVSGKGHEVEFAKSSITVFICFFKMMDQ
jgi:hypothetical protein